MSKQGRTVAIAAAVVLGAWLVLVFSSKGVLVYGDAPDKGLSSRAQRGIS
jgi:hypothetical protein